MLIFPINPHLDEKGAEYFRQRISKSQIYLEYGSGGSTCGVQEYKANVHRGKRCSFSQGRQEEAQIHSRTPFPGDSDLRQYRAYQEWGIPVFKRPTRRRVARWRHYVAAPWEKLRTLGIEPDTILVDGRFRVACVLQSLLNLSSRRDCLILVDDYLDRPQYHAVEEFTDIHAVHGRMAVMAKKGKIRRGRLSTKLVEYQRDWR